MTGQAKSSFSCRTGPACRRSILKIALAATSFRLPTGTIWRSGRSIPSPDGRFVYFTAGTGAWRVDLDDFSETQLADFGAVEMREKGMVGAAMGTTALSADGRWWAIPVKAGKVTRFVVIDTADHDLAASFSNAILSAIRSSARTTTISFSTPAR